MPKIENITLKNNTQKLILISIESFIIEFENKIREQSILFYSEQEEQKFLKAALKAATADTDSEQSKKIQTRKLHRFIKAQRLRCVSKHSIEEIDRIGEISHIIHQMLKTYQIKPSEKRLARSDNPFKKIKKKIITQYDESLAYKQ